VTHILYSFRRCPYAMRARMALRTADVKYEHREVLLRNKPQAMLEASPKGSVPVFIHSDGTVIDESVDIMRWALPNADFDLEVLHLIDGPFKHHLDRYKYASRYDVTLRRGDVDLSHRAEAVSNLNSLEQRLSRSPYLSGKAFGPTDMAVFPFVRQFAAVEPIWWAEDSGLSRLRDWLSTCLEANIFKSIMIKHQVWSSDQ